MSFFNSLLILCRLWLLRWAPVWAVGRINLLEGMEMTIPAQCSCAIK